MGAGWYTRHAAANGMKDCFFCRIMKVIKRPEAESSSRPLTPSPPLYEGGGGVGKTFVYFGFNASLMGFNGETQRGING